MDSLPALERAFDECATEDKRISAEIRMLQSFMKEVGDLQAVDVGPDGGRSSDSADGAALSDVMDSYRATVTDVDHYQEDYGEPAGVHMAKDFGKAIAKLIHNGGVLSESVKVEVLKQARHSISVREEALAGVDVEQDGLETFRGLLEQVDGQRGNICEHLLSHDDPDAEVFIDISTRVDRIGSRLEQITDDRIEMLWDPPAFDGEVPDSSLCEYRKGETGRVPHFYDDLYRRIEAIDPVLASAATVANRCSRIQEAVVCLLGEMDSEYSPYDLDGR